MATTSIQSTPLEESVEEIVEQDPLLADELPVTENGQDVEHVEQEEIVEAQEPETLSDDSADLEEEQLDEKLDSFGRMVRYSTRGGKTADYLAKKSKERSDLNKKNDPGMAKKGYALSVTDREKAMKKARKRGLEPKYPTQKYGKRKLPENEVNEKTLTPAEKKKREDVAKAIERDNPNMPMDKKMAIATATAKKVAESSISDRTKRLIERAINRKT